MRVKIRKGDTVEVISGRRIDKGKRGEVIKVLPDEGRIVVQGVNIRKKHQRPISQTRTQTGIIDMELPIHVSNVMVVCPNCDEAARLGFRFEDEKKVRYCKRCDANID